ncbi:MAG: hypothetical protein HGA45_43165, partial [Chloroflexales bacterium]|nr:hypothetical protein [Chloroflexales bacterium]
LVERVVDVSGLGPGSYALPVSLALPDGVSLVGDPPTVQVSLRSPSPTTAPATPADAAQGAATATPPATATPTNEPQPTPTPAAEPSPTAPPSP